MFSRRSSRQHLGTFAVAVVLVIGLVTQWSANVASASSVIQPHTYMAPGTYSLVVPVGMQSMNVVVCGARGGDGGDTLGAQGGSGGLGGETTATIAVSPNSVLTIVVGARGKNGSQAWNHPEGGAGGAGGPNVAGPGGDGLLALFDTQGGLPHAGGSEMMGGGGGGGGSAIFLASTELVSAGGGGGGGGAYFDSLLGGNLNSPGNTGGAGGGASGLAGNGIAPGQGGTQGAGGAPGAGALAGSPNASGIGYLGGGGGGGGHTGGGGAGSGQDSKSGSGGGGGGSGLDLEHATYGTCVTNFGSGRVLVSFSDQPAPANHQLHVQVFDSCTRIEVPRALVTLTPGRPVIANDGGNAFFRDLALGTYVVSVSADGYEPIGGDLTGAGGISITIGAAGDPSADVVQLRVGLTSLDPAGTCAAGTVP